MNTFAPFRRTALIEPPQRLIYRGSGLHLGGEGSPGDLDWAERRWTARQPMPKASST